MSRLDPLKRVDLIVRALAEPPARHVRVIIAGDGDSRANLAALARSIGVDDRVSFFGAIDEAAWSGILRAAARCASSRSPRTTAW